MRGEIMNNSGDNHTSEQSPMQGVWKLVSTKALRPDGGIDSVEVWHMLKIVTKKFFAFVEQEPGRPRFTKGGSDAEMLTAAKTFFAGGGTYTWDDTSYTETITHFFNPNYVGLSIRFASRFFNDLWILSGTFPVKSAGMPDSDYEMIEIYRRVE
jgi:hypothetical protein